MVTKSWGGGKEEEIIRQDVWKMSEYKNNSNKKADAVWIFEQKAQFWCVFSV